VRHMTSRTNQSSFVLSSSNNLCLHVVQLGMQAYRTTTAPRSLYVYNTLIRLATSPLSEPSHSKRHSPETPCRQPQRLASSSSQRSTKFRKPRHVEKPAKMSWMDSWSRPSKSQATPAPYYLLPGGESTPYCKTCGRVIGES
jgi:hypothetical protein